MVIKPPNLDILFGLLVQVFHRQHAIFIPVLVYQSELKSAWKIEFMRLSSIYKIFSELDVVRIHNGSTLTFVVIFIILLFTITA